MTNLPASYRKVVANNTNLSENKANPVNYPAKYNIDIIFFVFLHQCYCQEQQYCPD